MICLLFCGGHAAPAKTIESGKAGHRIFSILQYPRFRGGALKEETECFSFHGTGRYRTIETIQQSSHRTAYVMPVYRGADGNNIRFLHLIKNSVKRIAFFFLAEDADAVIGEVQGFIGCFFE